MPTVFRELMEWSGGVPQLSQDICGELVAMLNNAGRRLVIDGDINNVCYTMLKERKVQSSFSTFLEMGLPDFPDEVGPRNPWRPVYEAIATTSEGGGTCPMASLPDDIGFRGKLELLIERRAVVEVNGAVKLRSRLFAEWLRSKRDAQKSD